MSLIAIEQGDEMRIRDVLQEALLGHSRCGSALSFTSRSR